MKQSWILPERGEAPKLHSGPPDILMYTKLLQEFAPIDWIAVAGTGGRFMAVNTELNVSSD